MAGRWRLLDSGLRPAAQNIALDRALLEARQAGEIASTLRFMRFAPCALLGNRQSAAQELDLDYCRAHRIGVQRRITGGPAAYCDEGQLGWELILALHELGTSDVSATVRRLGHAVATGIAALGVPARVRSGGEIEVDGRSIGWTAVAVHGDALLAQGLLLLEADPRRLLSVLRLSAAGLSEALLAAARGRFASLAALLGRVPDGVRVRQLLAEAFESDFGVELSETDLGLTEHARYHQALAAIDSEDWVNLVARPAAELQFLEACGRIAGGRLRAAVAFDTPARVVRKVWFAVDAALDFHRMLAELEAALRDTPLERLEERMHRFFRERAPQARGLAHQELLDVLWQALRQPLLARSS
jgi:lipoate-protein ligase A